MVARHRKCPVNMPAQFDEATYLNLNPDVAAAVRDGGFASGWEHFCRHGYRESRPGVSAALSRALQNLTDAAGPEPPPPHLRKRVHGDEDLAGFGQIGKTVALNILGAIQQESIELAEGSRILDFGCGCGRVVVPLSALVDGVVFFGTDIDAEAIAWCRGHLVGIGAFSRNEAMPPLPFPNGHFDFVFSISIFTHLPEQMQFVWLEELQRVTQPGGHLLLSVHGPDLLAPAGGAACRQLESAGFYYWIGTGTEGLPSFYRTSYHTESYIRSQWDRFFEIRSHVKKGINSHQDLVIARRRD